MISHLLNQSVKNFIKENVQEDPARLSLKYKSIEGADIKLIVGQIVARQKAATKIPSWADNYDILFPGPVAVEQASSQKTAEYKANLLEGELALDLTGGLGIDTAAFAKGFNKIIYVEADSYKAQVAKHNFSTLGINNIEVINSTAEDFLNTYGLHANLIYLDPDRRPGAGRIISLEESTPDVVQLRDQLLTSADHVLIKSSPMLDITTTVNLLGNVSKVHVVAVQNECKELLLLMGQKAEEPLKITAASYIHDQWQAYTSDFPVVNLPNIDFPKNFIYEPDAAILKAGIQEMVAKIFNLSKLHSSTNLYTSASVQDDYPGRVFKLHEIIPVNKKVLKKYLPELKANLTTRNFPEHIDKLKKKLQLKDGGKCYLFACRLPDLTYKLLITEKA